MVAGERIERSPNGYEPFHRPLIVTRSNLVKEQIKRPESFDPGLLKNFVDSRDLWRSSCGHFDRTDDFCDRREMESAYHV